MFESQNLPLLVLKNIEVGGRRLPLLYRTYAVGGANITVRYSKSPYVRLSYDASNRRVRMTPLDVSDLIVDAWEHSRFSKRRVYSLSGERVDATVGQIFDAVSAEEIGETLKPLTEYFAQTLHTA